MTSTIHAPNLKEISIAHMRAAGVQHPERDFLHLANYATAQGHNLENLIARRTAREPMERITGHANFCDLDIHMHPQVFKPCFETQTTIEHAFLMAQRFTRPVRILDVGTGTGCILIALLAQLPHATGLGIDCNEHAITLATHNAQNLGVAPRAQFRKNDWMASLDESFDIIISNPPRVPRNNLPHLVREVAHYDPRESIDGGRSGLDFYHRIAREFRACAAPDALGIVQVGLHAGNPDAVSRILRDNGYANITVLRDYKYAPNCITFDNAKPSTMQNFFHHLRSIFPH